MADYIEPGTRIQVLNQTTPPALAPSFITALVGTTSTDKPVTTVLTRDNTTDGDKTLRRDILDTTVTSVENVVDQYGVQYIKNQDWSSIDITSTTYVEMATHYVSTNPISGITFSSFSGETENGIDVTPITSIDGAQDLVYVQSTNTITWGGGSGVVLSTDGAYELKDSSVTGTIIANVIVAALPVTGTTTDVVTLSTLGPAVGSTYTVSYHKNKTTVDLIPAYFDDLTSLQAFHGTVLNDSTNYPEVSNAEALSIGAAPYFGAGGGSVLILPVRDKKIDTVDGWDIYNASTAIADAAWGSAIAEALTTLEDQANVSCIIVLTPTEQSSPTGFRPAVLSAVISHINKMNAITENKPRIAILGARANTTTEAVFTSSANYTANENIIYMAPSTATKVISGYTKLLNGSTIAAGLAGILSNPGYNAGEPISGKRFQMFDNITDPFSGRLQRNRVAQTGITMIESQNGVPTVRHFLTTNQTSILTGEGKVSKIKIDIRRTLKQALDATVINKRLVDGETTTIVRSLLGLLLSQKVTDQVINAFNITKIAVNSIDQRQLDVQVEIKPTFDLNYIVIDAIFVVS